MHTLLMMTDESMLSKRPVLILTVALLFFLTLFSSHVYCVMKYIGNPYGNECLRQLRKLEQQQGKIGSNHPPNLHYTLGTTSKHVTSGGASLHG